MTFRDANSDDFLGSQLRQFVLSSLAKREVDFSQVRKDISELDEEERDRLLLTDKRNPLGEWQKAHAVEHWKCESSF